MLLEIVEVVVLVDRALRRGHVGDPHRADDAVVIQRVANPVVSGPASVIARPRTRRVGGVEDARRRSIDEPGDTRLEPGVRRKGAVDEANGAGTGAERVRSGIGRSEHVGMIGQRQVAVAVHAQEVAVAAVQPITRPARARGRHVADDDPLGRFGAPFFLERRDVGDERRVELVQRHEGGRCKVDGLNGRPSDRGRQQAEQPSWRLRRQASSRAGCR